MEEIVIDWNFNESDWIDEISSGYSGCRNKLTGEWIFDREYMDKKHILEEFERFKSLSKFFNQSNDDKQTKEMFTNFKQAGFLIFKKDDK